jgi:hypothetical protein
MFDSLARGFKMIWASIKMGWQDKRLLIPSILTVLTNIVFGLVLIAAGNHELGPQAPAVGQAVMQRVQQLQPAIKGAEAPGKGIPTFGLLDMPSKGSGQGFINNTIQQTQLNGPGDPSGFDGMGGLGKLMTTNNAILITLLTMTWWLTNRFLEGVTTALVYSHLTEGKGSGSFGVAVKAVFSSLPAIVVLGMVTFIARRLSAFLKNKRGSGVLGMSLGFVAGFIEIFWTLAGHLILPAIVIEGSSFWGALKRADKIAQGNLLTMGIGEVGVEGICKLGTMILYSVGMAGLGGGYYATTQMHIPMNMAAVGAVGFVWVLAVVVTTALSIYIRSAFYTCLYVWAIEAESVDEGQRARVKPPEPLALALA